MPPTRTRGVTFRTPTRASQAVASGDGDDDPLTAGATGSPPREGTFAAALGPPLGAPISLLPAAPSLVSEPAVASASEPSSMAGSAADTGAPPAWAHAFGQSLAASISASVDQKLVPLQLDLDSVKAAATSLTSSPGLRGAAASPAASSFQQGSPPRDDAAGSQAGSGETGLSSAVTLLETTFGLADPTLAYDHLKCNFSAEAARGVDKLLQDSKLTHSKCLLLNTSVGAARALLDVRRVLIDSPDYGPDSSLVISVDTAVEACGRGYGRILLRRDASIKTVAEAERHWDAISTKLDSTAACNAIDGVVVPFAEMQEYLVTLHKEAAQRAKDAHKRPSDKALKAEHDDKPSPSAAKLETALAKAKKREGELDKRASQFAKFIKDQGLELPAKPAATSRKGRAAKGGQGPAEAGADP